MIWNSIKPGGVAPNSSTASRLVVGGCGLSLALSVAAGVDVALRGASTISTISIADRAVFGWRIDGWAVAMWMLVSIVGLVVAKFSGRYLVGEPGAGSTELAIGALVLATTEMATSSTIVSFAIGWTAASVLIAWLLLAGRKSAQRDDLARSLKGSFVVGDGALWLVALVATVARDGSFSYEHPMGLPVAAVLGVLLSIAVGVRGGLVPTGRWLTKSIAAPTPVSAVLHAGIVNAGGLLLIREAALWHQTWFGPVVLAVAACTTIVVGSSAMAVAPDIKGSLVRSTAMQMAFMLVCCALGWSLAAMLHLVTHAMYKARSFLRAGSAVDVVVAQRSAPPVAPVALMGRVLGALVPVAIFAGSFALPLPTPVRFAALLATAAAIVAIEASLTQVTGGDRAGLVGVVVVTIGAYVVALGVVTELIGRAAEVHRGLMVPPVVLVATIAAAALLVGLLHRPSVVRSRLGRQWLTVALAFSTARPRRIPLDSALHTRPVQSAPLTRLVVAQ